MMLEIHNDGQRIVSTNYWQYEYAQAGKVYCSVNAGAIRVLLPPAVWGSLNNMQTASEIVCSIGPWPDKRLAKAVEILFDDGSPAPYALHLDANSFGGIPGEPPHGREWMLSVWMPPPAGLTAPQMVFEHVCHWRRVDRIPCLAPWS
jgi:hypothetical protein